MQNRFTLQKLILLTILVIAFGLRFHYLYQIEHNVDHAYPIWQALRTLHLGEFPLIGQGTSILFANPPLTGYLTIPGLVLSGSIVSVYITFVGLNTLGVYLSYLAFRQLIGERLALLATFFFAVNPWVIEYSRLSWPPALLPFFMSAVFWLLTPVFLGTLKDSSRRLIAGLLMLGLMTQTTLIAYFALPAVFVLLLIFRKRLPKRGLLIGIGIFALIQAVYIGGLLGNWEHVSQDIAEFAQESTGSELKLDAGEHAFRLVTGHDYDVARGTLAPIDDTNLRQDLSRVSSLVMTLALFTGMVAAGLAIFRPAYCNHPPEITEDHAKDTSIILLIWFILPIMAMSYNGSPVHPYYQLVGLPAGYVLAAWGVAYVLNPYTRNRLIILLILAIPFGILMGLNSTRYYHETEAIPGAHDLGAMPVDWGLALGERINQHLPDGGIVYADVDEWILNSFSGRIFPVSRDARAPAVTVIPARGGLYIVSHEAGRGNGFVPEGAERVELLQLPDGVTITIDRFPVGTEDVSGFVDFPVLGEKWLDFVGYRADRAGGRFALETLWRVMNPTPELAKFTFSPFVHVFDGEGTRMAIFDGPPIAGNTWRAGDLHLHRMSIDFPESVDDTFTLKIGQFDGLANQNIIFILPDGTWDALIPLPVELRPIRGRGE